VILGIVGRDELRRYVHERVGGQLPEWLRILPPVENAADLYQAAAIFLSASRSEGLPWSVCEAMANRLPVILSDIPSVSCLHQSPGALFFPCGDSAALTAAIREVLDWNAEEREQHTVANEHLVKTEFDVSTWADRILRLYTDILGRI
jgi:glycosyltransferase involved in cell wall biosynthesis